MEIIQHGRLRKKVYISPTAAFPHCIFLFFSCCTIAVACPPPMSGKMKEAENIVVARTDRARRGEERSTLRSFLFSFFHGKASGGGGGSFFPPSERRERQYFISVDRYTVPWLASKRKFFQKRKWCSLLPKLFFPIPSSNFAYPPPPLSLLRLKKDNVGYIFFSDKTWNIMSHKLLFFVAGM